MWHEQDLAQLLQQASEMLERQRIPSAGDQPVSQIEWEALIAREATAYFDKLDVCDCVLVTFTLSQHLLLLTTTL